MSDLAAHGPATSGHGPDPILPTTRKGRRLVVAILGLALLLRVGAVVQNMGSYRPLTDAKHFDLIATSLADGHGYGYARVPPNNPAKKQPSAFRAPLYPASLAVVYAVFGDHSYTAGRLVNALIGTMAVAVVGIVAALLWGRRKGLIAMALAAIYPAMILTGSSLQLEPLLVVLSLAAVAAALQHRRAPQGWRWPAVAGVCLGLAVLTRETGFFVVPAVVWLVWTAGPDGRSVRPRLTRAALAAPLVALALSFCVVVPWTIRNAVKLHAFVPVSTSSGIGLAGTYNETSVHDKVNRAQWIDPGVDPEMRAKELTLLDASEAEVDIQMRKAAIHVAKKNPSYPFVAAYWNTERLFDLDRGHYSLHVIAPYVPYSRGLTKVAILSGWLFMALSACALLLARFRRDVRGVPLAVWSVPVLTYLFMVFLLPASIRYRASLEPFFVLLATLPVAWLLERIAAAVPDTAPEPSRPVSVSSRRSAEPATVSVAAAGNGVATHTAAPAMPRFVALDMLRAVAAIAVVATHAYEFNGGLIPGDRNPKRLLVAQGATGVWLFFVLSGFVIARPFIAGLTRGQLPDLRSYSRRRLLRIYPAFWLSLFAVILFTSAWSNASTKAKLSNLLLLHNLVPGQQNGTIIGVWWTLSLEILFYLFVPVAAWVALQWRPRGISARHLAAGVLWLWGLSLVWALGASSLHQTEHAMWLREVFPAMLCSFCPGILLAVAEQGDLVSAELRSRIEALLRQPMYVFGAVAVLFGLGAYTDTFVAHVPLHVLALQFYGLAYGLVVAWGLRARVPDRLWTRVLAWLGLVSYGIYIWHAVIGNIITHRAAGLPFTKRWVSFGQYSLPVASHPGLLNDVFRFVWLLALTLVVAAVSWYAVESPLIKLAHRSRRRAPTPEPTPAERAPVAL